MLASIFAEDTPHRSMTFAEWAALSEDEPGELVDGRLEEEEVPSYIHEVVVGWFIHMLRVWLVSRGGFVAGSEAKFAVTPRRGRKPDLSAYLPGRRPPPRSPIEVPPDIMVEVISPTPRDARRDRIDKLREYAAFGVRWYWLVDPQMRTLEVYELGERGRYIHALGATEGSVELPGCEGLTLDLDALWGEVARLEAPEAETSGEEDARSKDETASEGEAADEAGGTRAP
jgi:Uma2 family endonuclease